MPIKGLSEQRRIPRVGKIHLGVKKTNQAGKEYPSATEYFVVPPEVAAVHGDEPTELPIMIPVEDEEYWASQYYRAYSQTRGLTCKGDGETCRRMIDVKTGSMADRSTGKVEWKEMTCKGQECSDYQSKKCREVMNLQFLLPEVPGLGVWQIDTSSVNSIRNINSSAALIRGIIGRVRMIPLILSLSEIEVNNPDDGKKKKVHVMNLRHGAALHSLISDSIKPIQELLAPPPDDSAEPPMDVEPLTAIEAHPEDAEQDIKDFFPEAQTELPQSDSSPSKVKVVRKSKKARDPASITDIAQLAEALKRDFGLSYQQQWDALGISDWHGLAAKSITPAEAYQKIVDKSKEE